MTAREPLIDPPPRLVAVAHSRYNHEDLLPDAVAHTNRLATLLGSYGVQTTVIADTPRGQLLNNLERALPEGGFTGAALVVLWVGHGKQDGDSLFLIGTEGDRDVEVFEIATLARRALLTDASQLLLIVDACFSGGGIPEAIGVAQHQRNKLLDVGDRWFGILTACRADEFALSGALASGLQRVLEGGGTEIDDRFRRYQLGPWLDGEQLLAEIKRNWPEPSQTPEQVASGTPLPWLRNPVRPPSAEGVLEHLKFAARGTSGPGDFFIDRVDTMRRIRTWLDAAQPGVLVVTGPPGSGKSAIVGRIVSLSNHDERTALLQTGRTVDATLDPGEGSIDAHLHARNTDVDQAVTDLAMQLDDVYDQGSIYELFATAHRERQAEQPLVIAIDGLDEAGAAATQVIDQLIVPLAKEALVLVSSRDIPGADGSSALARLHDGDGVWIDLGDDPEGMLDDVHAYVRRRLDPFDPPMSAERVADAVVDNARAHDPAREGAFLVARLVTAQLRERPVDTATPDWRDALATSVSSAIEYDLATTLTIDGRDHPTAARELLRALAFALGPGFPLDELWPAVATTLSPTDTVYDVDDLAAVLLDLGRHVVSDRLDDDVVFRVGHQRTIDHLMQHGVSTGGEDAEAVAHAVAATYTARLDAGATPDSHRYLWLHAWRHFAAAGGVGIDLLRELSDRDVAFRLDLALALHVVGFVELTNGEIDAAIDYCTEAVELWQDIAPDDPRLVFVLFTLASAYRFDGDPEAADEAVDDAVRLAWMQSDDQDDSAGVAAVAVALIGRAQGQIQAGDYETALAVAGEGLRLIEGAEQDDTTRTMAVSLHNVSAIALLTQGRIAEAQAEADAAVAIAESLDDLPGSTVEPVLLEALLAQGIAQLTHVINHPEESGTAPLSGARRVIARHFGEGTSGRYEDVAVSDLLRYAALVATVPDVRLLPDGVTADALLPAALDLVRPYATEFPDGAVAFAAGLLLRATLGSDTPIDDLCDAVDILRRFADNDARASRQLGSTLVRLAAATAVDASYTIVDRIDMTTEAADHLIASTQLSADVELVQALAMRYAMLQHVGLRDERIACLELMIEVLRESEAEIPQREELLAAMIGDHAGVLLDTDPAAALDASRDALARLDALPAAATHDLLRAQAHLTMSLALNHFDRLDEAAAELAKVQPLLEGNDSPLASQILGLALAVEVELALIDDPGGDHVADARRSLELVDVPAGTSVLGREVVPFARIRLARALRAVGDDDAAEGPLSDGVSTLVALLNEDPATIVPALGGQLNRAAPKLWDDVLGSLDVEESTRHWLRLYRARPAEQLAETIADIVDTIEADIPMARITARVMARVERSDDPERFDDLWQLATGQLPAWLRLSPDQFDLVTRWIDTPTWEESRRMLAATPELLEPATDVVLDELGFEEMWDDAGGQVIEIHRDLLAAARAGEADGAFDALIADALADAWDRAPDPLDHIADIELGIDPELLADRIEDDVQRLAALFLVSNGEAALVRQIAHEQVPWHALLQAAWRALEIERLQALAYLCIASERSGLTDRTVALVALAIADALMGDIDAAVAQLDEDVIAVAGDAARDAVVEVLARHPDYAEQLAPVLAALEES